MEIYPYDHVIEYERGFSKQGRKCHGVEIELIVEHSVVGNAAVVPLHRLRTGAVRDDFKAYLFGGQQSYRYFLLMPGKTPHYHILLVLTYTHLREQFLQKSSICLVIVFPERSHKQPRNIRSPRTYGQMVRPFAVEMMGTLGGAHHHNGTILTVLDISIQIEHRLFFPFTTVRTIKQPVKEFGKRLGGSGLESEYPPGISVELVQACILHCGKRLTRMVQKLVHHLFQRKIVFRNGLKMKMIRCGCP